MTELLGWSGLVCRSDTRTGKIIKLGLVLVSSPTDPVTTFWSLKHVDRRFWTTHISTNYWFFGAEIVKSPTGPLLFCGGRVCTQEKVWGSPGVDLSWLWQILRSQNTTYMPDGSKKPARYIQEAGKRRPDESWWKNDSIFYFRKYIFRWTKLWVPSFPTV